MTCKEGINLALKENYIFKECSCLQNKNVSGAFESLIERWNFKNKKERQKKEGIKRVDTITFNKSKDFISELDDIKGRENRIKSSRQSNRIILTVKQTPSDKKKCC